MVKRIGFRSRKKRALARGAMELGEDEGLESRVEARRRIATRSRWISHSEVKRRLRIL